MSIPTLDTTTKTDEDIFASIHLEETVPCSFNNCEKESISLLKCPQCGAAETMCAEHTAEVIVGQKMWPPLLSLSTTLASTLTSTRTVK